MMRIKLLPFSDHRKWRNKLFLSVFLLAFFIFSPKAQASVASDSLLGYWKFDGNLTDFSGDGSTANLSGTTVPGYSTGKPTTTFPNSQSLIFNGYNSSLTFANQTGLKPSPALTLSFWIYLNAYPSSSSIIAGNYLASYNQGFFFTLSPDTTSFSVGSGSLLGTASFSTSSIPVATWVLLTGTWDGTTVKLYKNGTLLHTMAFSGSVSYTNTIFQAGNFLGKMDDLRLYKRALSQAEVTDLANGHHTTAIWNGGTDIHYENPNNWTPTAVPDLYALISITNGANQPELAANESVAGLTIDNNAQFNLKTFGLTLNDGGTFSNNGTLAMSNSQTLSNLTNDTDSGTILIDSSATTTWLRLGNEYHNLTIQNANGITAYLNGNLTVHGDLTLASGTFATNNYNITLSGNWLNTGGTFLPGSGTVTLSGSGQLITGSNNFYALTKITATTDTLTFGAGTTQTVSDTLTLQGASATPYFLALRSSTSGTTWNIDPRGEKDISIVDVRDSININSTAIELPGRNINSGNNTNWTFDTTAPTPIMNAVSSPSSNSQQPVTGTGAESLATVLSVEFQMDSTTGSWTACSANDGTFNGQSEPFTCTPATLSDGTHTMYVRATDTNGNTTTSNYPYATFVVDAYHELTYLAGANGTTSGTSPQTISHSASGSAVTAVPDTNYHFVAWSDTSTQNPRTDTNVTANISVTANFAIDTYTLTYTAGTNGTISGTSSQSVDYGTAGSEVTAVPDAHYHFVDWSDGVLTTVRTDLNVTENKSVTANFAFDNFTVTFNKNTGTSEADPTTRTADYNTTVTLPTPPTKTGYTFVSWNTQADGNGTTFTSSTPVTANINVYAIYSINTYTLTYAAGSNGSITGDSPQTVNYNTSGSAITANPSTGYHFVNWSDSSTQNPRTDMNVTTNKSVTASFAIDTFTLKYKSDSNGKIDGDATQTVNYAENGTKVEAKPDTGYKFKQWSDDEDNSERKDENVKADLLVTAEFEKETYTLKYTAGAHGTIDGDTKQTITYQEDGEEVAATADDHYHFTSWSDGATKRARTDTDIKKDLTLTANFAPDSTSDQTIDQPKTSSSSENTPTTPQATAPIKSDFNGETTSNWQNTYFGSGYCYEQTKCGGTADPDGDGINNNEEFRLGTDPTKADSDQDGLPDDTEIETGHDPTISAEDNPTDEIEFEDPQNNGTTKEDTYQVNDVEMVSSTDGKKHLKLSGKAKPNSFVTIYIHSDPLVLTVKTDADGNWSYTLDEDIEDGKHEVYVAVTDSTGKISDKSKPLAFVKTAEAVTIIPPAEASATERTQSPIKTSYQKNLLLSIAIGIGALLLALFTIGLIRHKKVQPE